MCIEQFTICCFLLLFLSDGLWKQFDMLRLGHFLRSYNDFFTMNEFDFHIVEFFTILVLEFQNHCFFWELHILNLWNLIIDLLNVKNNLWRSEHVDKIIKFSTSNNPFINLLVCQFILSINIRNSECFLRNHLNHRFI